MSKINDKSLEEILSIISHYVLDSLREVVDFNSKSDLDREEILKVALKSLEVSSILTCKFFDSNSLNTDLLSRVNTYIKSDDFENANLELSK